MARNYYCLVAGLREIALDADRKGFDARAIIESVREELSKGDRQSLELFYGFYDVENLVNLRAGRAQFSTLGNFSREQLEQELKNPVALPRWMAAVVAAYANPEEAEEESVDTNKAFERSLFEAYYRACEQSKCRFIREWYEFDRNLRNVCATYMARKGGIAVADVVVGSGYVVDTLGRSSAADFGLKGELDYLDAVTTAVANDSNLVDKERRIDQIRWEMADELTAYDYFDMNGILGYLVRVNIVHRWVALDPAYGREVFDKLMASLSGKELIGKAEQESENNKNRS